VKTPSAFNNSYLKALQLRHRLRNDFNAVFRSTHPLSRLDREGSKNETPPHGVDFLLHLTTIQTAPRLDSLDTKSDGYAQDLLTVPASLAGLPCISIPGGLGDDGWPVGISLTGQWGSENGLLEVGKLGIESFESSERDV
jgi:aspartyl-tRNA(Asn)/glutamyl-tRNA(Gln) amidotransferase subunit A